MSAQISHRNFIHSLAWARENVGYSAHNICDIFQIEPSEKNEFLEKLQFRHIIRRVNTKRASSQDSEEEDFERYRENAEYAFCYAGIYAHKGCMAYILPKFADTQKLAEPELHKDISTVSVERKIIFEQTLKAIRRYHSKRFAESELIEQDTPHCHDLMLMITIVTDFAENGEYHAEHQIDRINGAGRYMWAHTINKKTALIQHGTPVYGDIITRHRIKAPQHPITQLHKKIVEKCYSSLKQLGLTDLLGLPTYHQDDVSLENEDGNYLLYLVNTELSQQFDTRRRHVLELLKEYLSLYSSRHTQFAEEYTFGCSSLHMLWEEACREVLGEDDSDKIQIEPPTWHMSTQTCKEAGTLKPDMIFRIEEGTCIMDAKYYIPLEKRGNHVPKGLPGVNDITKQFLYQRALLTPNAYISTDGEIKQPIYNAFLMPAPLSICGSSPIIRYATITMPLFPDLKIETLQISPIDILSSYAKYEKSDKLRKQIIQQLS